ncbi:hypothetical protein KEM55_000359 [Ascosphaera atra]|nr:hypothetical protein KEM55_000359 [Ascosphaera atra]
MQPADAGSAAAPSDHGTNDQPKDASGGDKGPLKSAMVTGNTHHDLPTVRFASANQDIPPRHPSITSAPPQDALEEARRYVYRELQGLRRRKSHRRLRTSLWQTCMLPKDSPRLLIKNHNKN